MSCLPESAISLASCLVPSEAPINSHKLQEGGLGKNYGSAAIVGEFSSQTLLTHAGCPWLMACFLCRLCQKTKGERPFSKGYVLPEHGGAGDLHSLSVTSSLVEAALSGPFSCEFGLLCITLAIAVIGVHLGECCLQQVLLLFDFGLLAKADPIHSFERGFSPHIKWHAVWSSEAVKV